MTGPSVYPGARLTARENEVIHLMTLGWTQTQIAPRLGIQVQTVNNHVMTARVKLNAKTTFQLIYRWTIQLKMGTDAHGESPEADSRRTVA